MTGLNRSFAFTAPTRRSQENRNPVRRENNSMVTWRIAFPVEDGHTPNQVTLTRRDQVQRLLALTMVWARKHPLICGEALVGSEARDAARPESDVDLILLTDDLTAFRRDQSWLTEIDWRDAGTEVIGHRGARYGVTWSCHIALAHAPEMEFGFAPRRWAGTAPIDPGTSRVVGDGCRILYDPVGVLAVLSAAVATAQATGSRNGP
jgi:hypothetical protein